MLDEEVIAAIKAGKFHVYAITSFKEGIQLLSGKSYDEIEARVKDKLAEYSMPSATFRKLKRKKD